MAAFCSRVDCHQQLPLVGRPDAPPEKEPHPQEAIRAIERRYTTPPKNGAVAFVSKSGVPVWWCNVCECFRSHLTEDHGCRVACSYCMHFCMCECKNWDRWPCCKDLFICFYCLKLKEICHCQAVDCLDQEQTWSLHRLKENAIKARMLQCFVRAQTNCLPSVIRP